MKELPSKFLILTHEGVSRVELSINPVYNLDALIGRFAVEKLLVLPHVSDSVYGPVHLAAWTSSPTRQMIVQELSGSNLVFQTKYEAVKTAQESWVSPVFLKTESGFDLTCRFEPALWTQSGLRLFVSQSFPARFFQMWVYYEGQIYRPPFGNIFDGTCQLCLGHNETAIAKLYDPKLSHQQTLLDLIGLLNVSVWNGDTFHSEDILVLKKLVRFDSEQEHLPMLPPLSPELIKKCKVAANKELADITAQIILAP